jgi:GNAT superfamily N-acetyltransferase
MSEILQDVSATALSKAIEDNQSELFALFGSWPKAELHDAPDILWSMTDIPFALFNSVLRAQLSPDRVDATIEQAIARARSRNVPVRWLTGPATRPPDLGRFLEVHGFVHTGDSPGMALEISSLIGDLPEPSGLVIERVADIETLQIWCSVGIIGFDMPDFVGDPFVDLFSSLGFETDLPLINYLGCLDGEPVAISSLFLGAGVAGIYNVATIPSARGKGIGTAMTAWAIGQARAMGYRVAILQASEMGVSVYGRLGFKEYCRIDYYLWNGEPAMPGAA